VNPTPLSGGGAESGYADSSDTRSDIGLVIPNKCAVLPRVGEVRPTSANWGFVDSAPAAWAWSDHLHLLSSDELRLEFRFAVLEQHANHLAQVPLQPLGRFPLRMGPRKAGNIADQQPGVRPTQNYRRKRSHASLPNQPRRSS